MCAASTAHYKLPSAVSRIWMNKQGKFPLIHPTFGLNHLWITPASHYAAIYHSAPAAFPNSSYSSIETLTFAATAISSFKTWVAYISPLPFPPPFIFPFIPPLPRVSSIKPFSFDPYSQHCSLHLSTRHQFHSWCQVLALSITISHPFFSLSSILFHQSFTNTPIHPVDLMVNSISHTPRTHPQRTQPLPSDR